MKQKERYIFDEFTPNPYLLIISLIGYFIMIFVADMRTAAVGCISFLLFAWSIAFSKQKKREVM